MNLKRSDYLSLDNTGESISKSEAGSTMGGGLPEETDFKHFKNSNQYVIAVSSASVLEIAKEGYYLEELPEAGDETGGGEGESSALGYIFSAQDTQEIQQGGSSSWDSENDELDPRYKYTSWNDGFQKIRQRIHGFKSTTTPAIRCDAYSELIQLMEDFLLAARTLGMLIISESHLAIQEKTIAPLSLGGVIGGQKFLSHGILFKFSSDDCGVFGLDSDAISAKISGHELKGLAAASSFDEDLVCPLMALIDYVIQIIFSSSLCISDYFLCLTERVPSHCNDTTTCVPRHLMCRIQRWWGDCATKESRATKKDAKIGEEPELEAPSGGKEGH